MNSFRFVFFAAFLALPLGAQSLDVRQVLDAPFSTSLVSAPQGARIAWVLERRGHRTVRVAQAPDWKVRSLVNYDDDDGRTLTTFGFTHDGAHVLYGHGNPYNPDHDTGGATGQRAYAMPFAGGEPIELGNDVHPVAAPNASRIAWAKGGTIRVLDLDTAERLSEVVLTVRGSVSQLTWSPAGERLAFRVARESFGERHAWIAHLELASQTLTWCDPDVYDDEQPRWSKDGTHLAFVRNLEPLGQPVLLARTYPVESRWNVRVVNIADGSARDGLAVPLAQGARHVELTWLDDSRLLLRCERDGWPRLWTADTRGRMRGISPERAWVDELALDHARSRLVWSTNAGDLDRRHLWIREGNETPRALTHGAGIEWAPVLTGDGAYVACLGSDAREPAHVQVHALDNGQVVRLDRADETFPRDQLVTPRPILVRAADGTEVHGQLFRPEQAGEERLPAVLFFHGGPMRQMMPGWHRRGYYHRCYAFNQLLAARGYVVLSVNYRLGVGYGTAFRDVADGGPRGASEYQDVLAAAAWLREQAFVDPDRIGLWGGSYGGYLTALGLARNSDLFAAGVDLHGVHDWNLWQAWARGDERAGDDRLAWQSSPIADVGRWRSPVLLVHGDDDRNVPFAETIRLVRELSTHGIPHERLILPDEVHSFLRHASWVKVFETAFDFLERHLRQRASAHTPVREGSARYVFDLGDERLEVFTYKPSTYRGERMLFVMHGTLRNADEYRDDAVAMGERFGALIVAPRFDRERFPSERYQFGGLLDARGDARPPEDWTWARLPRIAAIVHRMERRPTLPYWIIGHSAGGQFLVRMAGFFAPGAERIVAANPGSELFPVRTMPFGYGFGTLPPTLSDDATLRRYLAAPLTLYLGTEDDGPDRYFDQSSVAMQQGEGRYQRGRACFEVARSLATQNGWPFGWRLVEAPGVAHDHRKMFDHPACEEALFGVGK